MKTQDLIDKMNQVRSSAKDKGNMGERVGLSVVKEYLKQNEGVVYHSFKYPYAQDSYGRVYPGNIFRNGDIYKTIERDSFSDEIDILLITQHRVFPIEVKARSGRWKLAQDGWVYRGSTPEEKSPEAQAEKHARHLYHNIHNYLPNKDMNYIVPILVFVDEATVVDARPQEFKNYVRIAIINNLKSVIAREDVPGEYLLNIPQISMKLESFGTGVKY